MTADSSMRPLFDVLGIRLPKTLFSDHARASIGNLCSSLPALDWGGFECPLGGREGQVDYHQGLASAGDARLMGTAGIVTAGADRHPGWAAVGELCRRWLPGAGNPLGAIERIGLEYDLGPAASTMPPPSVFWSFRHPGNGLIEADHQRAAIGEVLTILADDAAGNELLDDVARVVEMLPAGATIVHAGMMLARPDSPLRINVWGLEFDSIPGFLAELGKSGTAAAATDLLDLIAPHCNSIVAGFDVGPGATDRIGLECTAALDREGNQEWEPLLTVLEERDLSTGEEGEAIVSWPGIDDPSTVPVAWPDYLIIASLEQPPERISTLRRTISHIKISMAGPGDSNGNEGGLDCHPAAKAYLEYRHSWLELV